MALGGLEQGLREALRVGCAHSEFGELETEEMEEMNHTGENGDGLDLDGIARNDGGDQAIARRIVFDESRVHGDGGLQFLEREIGRRFESSVLAFVGGEFAKSAQEFVFVRESLFLELLEAFDGSFFGAELLEFDAVVIPV